MSTNSEAIETILSKSPLARDFWQRRDDEASALNPSTNKILARVLNIDTNTYLDGAWDKKTKEAMGLAVSLALRCDDCVAYHLIAAAAEGATQSELEEASQIALTIGGTIVIPHLRRMQKMVNEIFAT